MKPDGTRHTLKDLYHENTAYDFLHRRWRWVLFSGLLLLVSVLGFVLRDGLNLGLDFTGGTSWQLTVAKGQSTSTADLRALLVEQKVSDPKIVLLGTGGVRVETLTPSPEREQAVTEALAKYGNVKVASVSVSEVGPSWGEKVSREALIALLMFFVAIALYLSLRFEFKMAVAAIIAVIHDIAITVGVYAVTGIEVTPATVIAFLTILGFSLYDTVVVFDKIRENEPHLNTVKGLTYTDMANQSLNQVLMRSLNTTFVALLPVTSLLVVGVWIEGALALREFGLALFIGLIIGGYSSLFVATPILAAWKEREPRYRALAERSAQRSKRDSVMIPVGGPTDDSGSESVASRPPTVSDSGVVIAPRARQNKGKKKK